MTASAMAAALVALAAGLAAGLALARRGLRSPPSSLPATLAPARPLLAEPIWVYNNWSAYDELSDNIRLTEDLAMRELGEILRLRKAGVHFDCYMMDAFWFAPDGAYRTWRQPDWPNGPQRWIAACAEAGLKPGLWFSTNTLVKLDVAPQWQESLAADGKSLSFFEGGFLSDFMDVLQHWYDQGIRMYKFDFADFTAATPAATRRLSKQEIQVLNENAFRNALLEFRRKNPDAIMVAFNGFGGDTYSTALAFPFEHPVNLQWLTVFDAIYCGDPRPSDVPEMNFWRSMDFYSDHMVRRYEQSCVPLERIDSTGFMLGDTGTIYYRKTNAWQGALLLEMARGGWINTVHGNLEFLDDKMAAWFAKLQAMYCELQAAGRTKTFGGIPGNEEPYGFGSFTAGGALYTVVNPAQSIQIVALPQLHRTQAPVSAGRVLFSDDGFVPSLSGSRITLGPGQMALIGVGKYACAQYDLGLQSDVVIPRSIALVDTLFSEAGKNAVATTVAPPASGDLRIVMQQLDEHGVASRSWQGAPPTGRNMGTFFQIHAQQDGESLPVVVNYDKVIWSGLSWAVGEIKARSMKSGKPIQITLSSAEDGVRRLTGRVYVVVY